MFLYSKIENSNFEKNPWKKILKNHNKLPTRNKRTDKSKKNKEISSDA